jgi:hypothetical protein
MLDPLAVVLTGVALLLASALMMQVRNQGRTRRLLQRDLERIFEQLDLLTQEQQEAALTPVPVARPLNCSDYPAALEMAARGASEHELLEQCGVSSAEARILVAMQGQRAGRRG